MHLRKRHAVHLIRKKTLGLDHILKTLRIVIDSPESSFAKGDKLDDARTRQRLHQFDQPHHGDATPLGDATPSLNAVMQRHVLVVSQRSYLAETQIHRVLEAAADAQMVVTEVVCREVFPFIGIRHLAVGPKVWRDVLSRVTFCRVKMSGCAHAPLERSDQRLVQTLDYTRVSPRDDVGNDPRRNHRSKTNAT